jgi:hypothetical protein
LDLDSLLTSQGFKPHNTIRFVEKALKAQRGLSKLEKDADAYKLLGNEFNELYLSTLLSYYISLHYYQEKKNGEALALAQHTISEITNCATFAQKSFGSR